MSLTDKVARESADAQTSDHSMHDEAKAAIEHGDDSEKSKQEKLETKDLSTKGPQISDDLPKVESTKEELLEKAKKMNE